GKTGWSAVESEPIRFCRNDLRDFGMTRQGLYARDGAIDEMLIDDFGGIDERRERARLRSLRWRQAHGISPRRPAERPWLVPAAREGRRAGGNGRGNGRTRGGARSAAMADCGTVRVARGGGGCAKSYPDQ